MDDALVFGKFQSLEKLKQNLSCLILSQRVLTSSFEDPVEERDPLMSLRDYVDLVILLVV